jgi:predicted house-cleaning noncanonical NTP pyrophosphatase (MazG superfamily)
VVWLIMECGCGRSPTGKCIGWHALSEEEYQNELVKLQAEEEKKMLAKMKIKKLSSALSLTIRIANAKATFPKA